MDRWNVRKHIHSSWNLINTYTWLKCIRKDDRLKHTSFLSTVQRVCRAGLCMYYQTKMLAT